MGQLGNCLGGAVSWGFGFFGFLLSLLFSFLSFGVLLCTSCALGLRPSALLIYATLLVKKKKC